MIMFSRILIPIFCLVAFSCKPSAKSDVSVTVVADDTITEEVAPKMVGDCYMYVSGNDSILMQIVIENNSAAGQLHYRFYEKDKSGGALFGHMRGDTLIADYKFIAEGSESEREVAFIRRGDTFVEGFGDSVEQDGRMVFKDVSGLKFEGQPMQKISCNGIARYFSK